MNPTIIIGVGGVGSSIVNTIKGKLPESFNSNKVSFIGMDTNIHDLKSLKNLTFEELIQTSVGESVKVYLQKEEMQGNNSHKVWFDDSKKEMRSKNMTAGAGQVRQVSRLALDAAISSGLINKLKSAISKLNVQDDSGDKYDIRVVIVSSLAGGTGSGIFQQVAFLTRKYLIDQGISASLFTGFFMLGNILEGTKTITRSNELDTIYSNTFASFKELAALTKATSIEDKEKTSDANLELMNLDFKFHPDINIGEIPKMEPPFNYYHLIDFNNIEGKNIATLDNYKNIIANTIYTYIFSPITDGTNSKLDNQILTLIKSQGQSRVCGSASGKLFYPFFDIVRLFALKRTNVTISDTWLKFDRLFDHDVKEIESKRRNGDLSTPIPLISEKYLFYLNSEVSKSVCNPTFKEAEIELGFYDEYGKLTNRKSNLFINELKAFVNGIFDNDSDLDSFMMNAYPQEEQLLNKTELAQEVENREAARLQYLRKLDSKMQDNQYLIRNVLLDDKTRDLLKIGSSYDDNKYCFNYWILSGKVMQPIAVRAFIYECINLLKYQLKNERKELMELTQSKEGFTKTFTDERGEDINPLQASNSVKKGGILNKLFKGKAARKDFADNYTSFVTDSMSNYKELARFTTLVKLKEDLLKKLELLSDNAESYFSSIDSILRNNEIEIDLLSSKYREEKGYDRAVLASPLLLQKIWDLNSIKLTVSESFPEELSLSIYNDWYQKVIKKSENENFEIIWDGNAISEIRETLVKGSEQFIKMGKGVNLDFDIIDAILYEADLVGIDHSKKEKYLEDRLLGLVNLVVEFGPDNVLSGGSRYAMWGINSAIKSKISGEVMANLQNTDPSRSGHEYVVNDFFDKKEITRAVILMGQRLDNFSSFRSDRNGLYFKAYKTRIKEVISKDISTVSPHLDKRWHMPKYLPEIEQAQTDKILNDLAKMMVYGLMSHKIKLLKSKGLTIWTFLNEPIYNFSGELIKGTTLFDLWDALQENMHIVAELKDFYYKQDIEKNFSLHMDDIKSYSFILNSKNINYLDKVDIKADHNILEIILKYALMPSANTAVCEKMLHGINMIIDRCMKVAFSSLDTDVQKDKRVSFIANNYARGNAYLKDNKFTTEAEYIKMKEIIDGNR